MKTLTVYFSYTAGNTKGIAEKVHAAVGGDLVELQPAVPYTGSYDEVVEQAQDEVRHNYRPALKPLGVRLADYDRIIIGTPTWWYTMAPAVATFLSSAALAGKEVVPFMTNAGWPGHVIKDMTALARQQCATVTHAHAFRFSADPAHFDSMTTPAAELDNWINELKQPD